MAGRPAAILGLGVAMPPAVEQARMAQFAVERCASTDQQARLLPKLYRKAHVEQRGSALIDEADPLGREARGRAVFPPARDADDQGPTTAQRMAAYQTHAPALAHEAAQAALADAQLAPERITHLITVTCTGFFAPGVDVNLIKTLGLMPTVSRTQIGFMGCHGALNGLRAAQAYVRADPDARVLLVAVELCTLHFQYGWEPQRVVANALFADGAGALVVGPENASAPGEGGTGGLPASAEAIGTGEDPDTGGQAASGTPAASSTVWELVDTAAYIFPDSEDAMTWQVGDHGFEMTLSPRVPDLIGSHLQPWLTPWLASHGLEAADIAGWAVHPGGPRVVDSTAQALDLPPYAVAASHGVLAQCGNMSSPTVLFILDRLRRDGVQGPCVMLGFGPGLAGEAVLLW